MECYLQNEGALIRFWYPVVYLERPPPGYRKSSALRGADAANMLVHRELLQGEASLACMYCRSALLGLPSPAQPSLEAELERLGLVASESLVEPSVEGVASTTCPDLAPSPASILHTLTTSPLTMFYSDVDRVSSELRRVLRVQTGRLAEVAQQVCACLSRAPRDFASAELKITEAKEAVDLVHHDAAFLVVSVLNEKGEAPPVPTYVCNVHFLNIDNKKKCTHDYVHVYL